MNPKDQSQAEADQAIPLSEVLDERDLFEDPLASSTTSKLIPIQTGLDLFYWSGTCRARQQMRMVDDTGRLSFSFTTRLQGAASQDFKGQGPSWDLSANEGYIQNRAGDMGVYSQHGEVESVTLIVAPEMLEGLVDDGDSELLKLARYGGANRGHMGGELMATANMLSREIRNETDFAGQRTRHKLWYQSQALGMLAFFFESHRLEAKKFRSQDLKRRVSQARDRLVSDLSLTPSIPEVAREVGVSSATLNRAFSEIYGLPPYKLFQRERLLAANIMLSAGRKNVTTVASELGYTNFSHFSAAFYKEFGVLPSEACRN